MVHWKNFVFYVARRAKRKIIYNLINCFTDKFEKNVKKFAMWREDHRLLAKIQDIYFSAKEVCYHSICRVEYENIAKATPLEKEELPLKNIDNDGEMKEQPPLWYQTRNVHKKALVELANHYHRRSYSGISIKRTPLVQKKCPLYRDVRFIEIFSKVV